MQTKINEYKNWIRDFAGQAPALPWNTVRQDFDQQLLERVMKPEQDLPPTSNPVKNKDPRCVNHTMKNTTVSLTTTTSISSSPLARPSLQSRMMPTPGCCRLWLNHFVLFVSCSSISSKMTKPLVLDLSVLPSTATKNQI